MLFMVFSFSLRLSLFCCLSFLCFSSSIFLLSSVSFFFTFEHLLTLFSFLWSHYFFKLYFCISPIIWVAHCLRRQILQLNFLCSIFTSLSLAFPSFPSFCGSLGLFLFVFLLSTCPISAPLYLYLCLFFCINFLTKVYENNTSELLQLLLRKRGSTLSFFRKPR